MTPGCRCPACGEDAQVVDVRYTQRIPDANRSTFGEGEVEHRYVTRCRAGCEVTMTMRRQHPEIHAAFDAMNARLLSSIKARTQPQAEEAKKQVDRISRALGEISEEEP